MLGSWSDNDVEMLEVVVESSKVQASKVFHNTTINEAIDINDISEP
jgi:hypothetical protein